MRLSSYLIFVLACAISLQMFGTLYRKVSAEHSKELDIYLLKFKEEMFTRGVQLDNRPVDITFQSSMIIKGSVGVNYQNGPTQYVEILKKYYKEAPAEVKEALLFHEFGHAYGLNHLDGYLFFPSQRICPVSVMHSADPLLNCYSNLRKYYLDELAGRLKNVDKEQAFVLE